MKKEFEDPSVLIMPMLSTTQTNDSTGGDGDVQLPDLPVDPAL